MKHTEVTIEELLSGKVRLEFGNEGQLTAIKNFEKKTEDEQCRCIACDGEGSIICQTCDGTGEKPQPKKGYL